jgi:hypothetical protein
MQSRQRLRQWTVSIRGHQPQAVIARTLGHAVTLTCRALGRPHPSTDDSGGWVGVEAKPGTVITSPPRELRRHARKIRAKAAKRIGRRRRVVLPSN